jgi:hypothetical protein
MSTQVPLSFCAGSHRSLSFCMGSQLSLLFCIMGWQLSDLWTEHIPQKISHEHIYNFRGMHLCKQIKRSFVTHGPFWLCDSWVNIYLYNQWICPLKFSFVVRLTYNSDLSFVHLFYNSDLSFVHLFYNSDLFPQRLNSFIDGGNK